MKLWQVVLGGLGLCVLAGLGAWAQRALAVEESVPQRQAQGLVPTAPPGKAFAEAIIAETRRVCDMFSEPELTSRSVAERFGRILDDVPGSGLDFVPANPCFMKGSVDRDSDAEGNSLERPGLVQFELRRPQDLPVHVLEAALGRRVEGVGIQAYHVVFMIDPTREGRPAKCQVVAETNSDANLGPEDTLVTSIAVAPLW